MVIRSQPKYRFQLETECINRMVEVGGALRISARFSSEMHARRYFLPDVRQVLGTGSVIRSDMLEDEGLWDVEGVTMCGATVRIRVTIDSVEQRIEPLRFV